MDHLQHCPEMRIFVAQESVNFPDCIWSLVETFIDEWDCINCIDCASDCQERYTDGKMPASGVFQLCMENNVRVFGATQFYRLCPFVVPQLSMANVKRAAAQWMPWFIFRAVNWRDVMSYIDDDDVIQCDTCVVIRDNDSFENYTHALADMKHINSQLAKEIPCDQCGNIVNMGDHENMWSGARDYCAEFEHRGGIAAINDFIDAKKWAVDDDRAVTFIDKIVDIYNESHERQIPLFVIGFIGVDALVEASEVWTVCGGYVVQHTWADPETLFMSEMEKRELEAKNNV
jgi:hypothetical protein